MNTKYFCTLLLVAAHSIAMACPVCEQRQPELLRGLVHGLPQSDLDWVIVGIALAITLYTLFRSAKLLIWPGEREANHIKKSILPTN